MDLTISKLPWYGQAGVFAGLLLAAFGLFWFYYVVPAQDGLANQNGELQQLRVAIDSSLTVARQLPQFQAQVAALDSDLESLKAVLPEEKDVADLLRRIRTLATQSNLTIRSFRPKPVETRAMLIEWPFRLGIDGRYHDLGLFFDRISRFPRLINVGEILVSVKNPPSGQASVTVECVATAFVLREPETAEPAVPAETVARR